MTDDQAVQLYLGTLSTNLRSLRPEERHEILKEIGVHIRDAVSSEEPVLKVLDRLGTPQQLANQYLDYETVQRAKSSTSPVALLRAVLRVAAQSAAGMLVFCFGISGYLTGAGLIISALLKPFLPGQIGLWRQGQDSVVAGLPKQIPASAPEVLGWWYVPIALLLGALLLLCTSLLIRLFLRLSRFVQTRFAEPVPRVAFAFMLLFGVVLLLPSSLQAQDSKLTPVGDWTGSLQVQSQELHLALHVVADQSGLLHATLDSIDQGAMAIPTEAVKFQVKNFSFDVPAIHGHYQGTMSAEAAVITGTWSQGAVSLPLAWKRGQAATLERPQDPKPPFLYKQEEVMVENPKSGVRLAGTFTEPEGKGPFPAVFLITGSGPQDRDETVFGHRPFLVLADFLTKHGIAVLRVDDRGTAKSTGDFSKATTEDFVSDALSAVSFLEHRGDINPKQLGLIGHSEGGTIAPMVAVQTQAVSFIVLLAGTAVPGEVLLPDQVYLASLAEGQSEAEALAQAHHTAEFMNAFDRGGNAEKAVEIMLAAAPEKNAQTRQRLEAEARSYATPWFRFFATYDPYPTLRKVSCPVLALNGSKDVQVPAALNIPFIRAATAWNTHSQVSIVPGMNHLFQSTRTGSPLEYAKNTETMSPVVLQQISDWIHQQL